MSYFKKYKFLWWIFLGSGVSALLMLAAVVLLYSFLAIQVPLDLFSPTPIILNATATSEIEEGAIIHKNDLKTYFINSEESGLSSYQDWQRAKFEENILFEKGNILEVKSNLVLSPLRRNDCKDIYCLQYLVPFDEIPPILWKTLIYIEDKRFLDHSGFDLYSIFRALINDLKKMRLEQGGSTLTQQLIKGVVLSNEKSFERKIKEIFYSYFLESKLSKEQIIDSYLNHVYWGSLQKIKIKGVKAASALYFLKGLNEITPYESVILIALLKGPHFLNPLTQIERLKKRVESLCQVLIKEGAISDVSLKRWTEGEWANWQENLIQQQKDFRMFSIALSERMPGNNLNPFEKYILHRSTIPLENDFRRNNIEDFAVKILIRDYAPKAEIAPTYYYSKVERNLENSTRLEKHQIGSIVKPVLYKIFLDKGLSWDQKIPTDGVIIKLRNGTWAPKESHHILEKEVLAKEALQRSLNNPLVYLANSYGFDQIEAEIQNYIPQIKRPLKDFPSQVLGSVELSLWEVSEMYLKFIKADCDFQKKGGEGVLQILSDQRNSTVKNVINKTLSLANIFGKTGTTNKGLDSWYVYFDGKQLGVIWVGVEGNRIKKSTKLSGSTSSFKVFQEFINFRGKRIDDTFCPF